MSNPLIELPTPFPFDAFKPEQLEPAIDHHLAQAKASIEKVKSEKRDDFNAILGALDTASLRLNYAYGLAKHLENVATTDELRAAIELIQPKVIEFGASLYTDDALYAVVKRYAANSDAKRLTGARARFLKRTVTEFRLNGAELSPTDKKKLIELDIRLEELGNTFSQNVVDSTKQFEWIVTSKAALAGLPESELEAARASAQSKNKEGYRFTLAAPSFRAIVTYLDDRAVREKFHRAYSQRASEAPFDNSALVSEMLAVRKERAKLLGFDSFADLVTHDRMARDAKTAFAFLESLVPVARAAAERDFAELQQFRNQIEGNQEPLCAWDIAYYSEKLQKQKYSYDPEEIRQYLSFESVMKGIFTFLKKLFGISVTQVNVPTWSAGVETWQMSRTDGQKLGLFFTDYFPRESKRAGAWMDMMRVAVTGQKDFEQGIGFMGGNFSVPTPDRPSLIVHDELTTLFHETGHLIHGLLTKAELPGQGFEGVPWDFVELPSQLLENWCWNKEVLQLFARHHSTGEQLSDNLIKKLLAARNFQAGMHYLRQLGFALLDLTLHTSFDPKRDGDPIEFGRNFLKQFQFAPTNDSKLLASFTHLFGDSIGYAAGYYSYLWSEALEADVFSRFEREGVLNQALGQELIEKILSRGDTIDANEQFENFMGRKLDPLALFRRAGLVN